MPFVLTFLFMTPSFQCITFYQNWIRLLVFLLIFQFLLSSAVLIDYPPQTCHSCISYVLPNRFPGSSDGKESAYNAGDPNLILGLGRCPGEGKGNSLQYSCLKNPMDRGAWQVAIHWGHTEWHGWSDLAHMCGVYLHSYFIRTQSLSNVSFLGTPWTVAH